MTNAAASAEALWELLFKHREGLSWEIRWLFSIASIFVQKKKKKRKKSRQCSLESNCMCPPSMTQAGQVPQSTGREKTTGTPSSSTGLPLVCLAQQVTSMNPAKNPKKIKPSQPAKLSVQLHLPPRKIHAIQFKTPHCHPLCRGVTQPVPPGQWCQKNRAHFLSALSTPAGIHHQNHCTCLSGQKAAGILCL